MNIKNLLQIIMITLFFVVSLLTLFKVVNLEGIALILGCACSAMYLLFSFWLLSSKESTLILRIVFGVIYSVLLLTLTYCFVSFSGYQLVAAFAFYFSLMLILACVVFIKNLFVRQQLILLICYLIVIVALFFRI